MTTRRWRLILMLMFVLAHTALWVLIWGAGAFPTVALRTRGGGDPRFVLQYWLLCWYGAALYAAWKPWAIRGISILLVGFGGLWLSRFVQSTQQHIDMIATSYVETRSPLANLLSILLFLAAGLYLAWLIKPAEQR